MKSTTPENETTPLSELLMQSAMEIHSSDAEGDDLENNTGDDMWPSNTKVESVESRYTHPTLRSKPQSVGELIRGGTGSPEYSPDMLMLMSRVSPQDAGLHRCHYNSAINFIARILTRMYGSTDIKRLYDESSIYGTLERFLSSFEDELKVAGFKQSTCRTVGYSIRKLLGCTALPETFVRKITYHSRKTTDDKLPRNDLRRAIPCKYRDSHVLLSWAKTILDKTRIRSIDTLKQIIYYVVNRVENLGLEFDPTVLRDLPIEKWGATNQHARYRVRTFLMTVCGVEDPAIPVTNNLLNPKHKSDEDEHRFTPEEMDAIYQEAKKDARAELIILLFVTTGMRIGGLVNIRMEDVCRLEPGGEVTVFKKGRTLTKGSKIFTFHIPDRVRFAMWNWIVNERPVLVNNPFLFPGMTERHITTSAIRQLIKKTAERAGVEGSHVHPHSFRHTYAHMLLESGNNIGTVSKMLGHSTSSVTEQFYLKESQSQVVKRANIPWMDDAKPASIVPKFMEKMAESERKRNKKQKRTTRKLPQIKGTEGLADLITITPDFLKK